MILRYKIDGKTIEFITYALGGFGIIFGYLYLAIYGKNFKPKKFFEQKKNQYKIDEYNKFRFNINDYNSLELEISKLKQEINDLKNNIICNIKNLYKVLSLCFTNNIKDMINLRIFLFQKEN